MPPERKVWKKPRGKRATTGPVSGCKYVHCLICGRGIWGPPDGRFVYEKVCTACLKFRTEDVERFFNENSESVGSRG